MDADEVGEQPNRIGRKVTDIWPGTQRPVGVARRLMAAVW